MSAMDKSQKYHTKELNEIFSEQSKVTCFPGTGRIDPRTIPGLMDSLNGNSHPLAPLLGALVGDMIERFGGDE